jgi:pimeloyl-ACP methyl ester carboxylesterase
MNYELVLRGEIGDRFGLLFEGMELSRTPGHTVLTGPVVDQAHLHGLIERIQELGLELVSVNQLPRKGPRMTNAPSAPDTIVLIHGFWMTPRSWEHWVAHYEAKGFKVLAPAYPGFEVEVEALNADPTPVAEVTLPQIVEHYERIIGELDSPPIIIGHSAGGAITQLLLDHGFGAAGVAINSAPTEGVLVTPWSQLHSVFPILRNPANRHRAAAFTFEQFHYAFTNGVDEDIARRAYERYAIPAPGSILFESVTANIKPGHQSTWVDYSNEQRAPLLFISGSTDHIMPPSVQRSNAKHYKAPATLTEIMEVEGPHFMVGIDGWEQIADTALEWALEHARTGAPQTA